MRVFVDLNRTQIIIIMNENSTINIIDISHSSFRLLLINLYLAAKFLQIEFDTRLNSISIDSLSNIHI